MKISIIYFSETGNTKKAAEFIKAGAESVENTEVRMFNLKDDNLDKEYIEESKAVIFGTPTYCANMCWQMKKFLDLDWTTKLSGKIGSVFATENSANGGGAELAIMSIINHILVKGMLVYSSGAEYGRPYIHIGPALVKDLIDEREDFCNLFGKRVAGKAHEIFDK